jgi:uncharacterized membrane protein
LLESDAIEISEPVDEQAEESPVRPLPATVDTRAEVSAWKGEARTAAIAAAGGLVAGAATVAIARATRGGSSKKPTRRGRSKDRPVKVLASRSFLVDVHLIDR